uniref:Uncharacterized protein n=1 Tax=Macaca fascicularis TaxID=9541 RepID=A0A7N9ICU8_MACFA
KNCFKVHIHNICYCYILNFVPYCCHPYTNSKSQINSSYLLI